MDFDCRDLNNIIIKVGRRVSSSFRRAIFSTLCVLKDSVPHTRWESYWGSKGVTAKLHTGRYMREEA